MLYTEKAIQKWVTDTMQSPNRVFQFLAAQYAKSEDKVFFNGYLYLNVDNPENGADKTFTVHCFVDGLPTGQLLFREDSHEMPRNARQLNIYTRIGAWMYEVTSETMGRPAKTGPTRANMLDDLGTSPAPKEWHELPEISECRPHGHDDYVALMELEGSIGVCAWFTKRTHLWTIASPLFYVGTSQQ